MLPKSEFSSIKVNGLARTSIKSGLGVLVILSFIGSFFILTSSGVEGTTVGRIIAPLFIFSEAPLLFNFAYFIILRLGLLSNTKNPVIGKISSFYTLYHPLGLLFHGITYAIVVGIALTHMLLVIQYAAYCVVIMGVLGLLWLFEYLFWINGWPLYPEDKPRLMTLYWMHWFILFGTLIGITFHAKIASLFWMISIPFLYLILMTVILQDVRKIRNQKRKTMLN
ncbi:MAG: hypothetical protein ACFFFG_01810 [Candidatus Thorarchaeota archaeon]